MTLLILPRKEGHFKARWTEGKRYKFVSRYPTVLLPLCRTATIVPPLQSLPPAAPQVYPPPKQQAAAAAAMKFVLAAMLAQVVCSLPTQLDTRSPAPISVLEERQSCSASCGSACYYSSTVNTAVSAGCQRYRNNNPTNSYPHTYNNYGAFYRSNNHTGVSLIPSQRASPLAFRGLIRNFQSCATTTPTPTPAAAQAQTESSSTPTANLLALSLVCCLPSLGIDSTSNTSQTTERAATLSSSARRQT